MKTIKEINKELEDNLKDYNQKKKLIDDECEKKREKLYKERLAIDNDFKKYLQKQFGKLDVDIRMPIENNGLSVHIGPTVIFLFTYDRMEFNKIEQELAEEIRTKYIETYGLPKEGYPLKQETFTDYEPYKITYSD